MQKKQQQQKTLQKKCYTQSSFTILAHVFLTISGRFCVKLIFSTCQHWSKSSACQTLVRATTWILATAAAAILESTADPNLTSEKVLGEIYATVDLPDSWHVYS